MTLISTTSSEMLMQLLCDGTRKIAPLTETGPSAWILLGHQNFDTQIPWLPLNNFGGRAPERSPESYERAIKTTRD
jgi:hypothetical protein